MGRPRVRIKKEESSLDYSTFNGDFSSPQIRRIGHSTPCSKNRATISVHPSPQLSTIKSENAEELSVPDPDPTLSSSANNSSSETVMLEIAKKPFDRLVRSLGGGDRVRWSKDAMKALQLAAENHLVSIFRGTQVLLGYRKGKIAQVSDIQVYLQLLENQHLDAV